MPEAGVQEVDTYVACSTRSVGMMERATSVPCRRRLGATAIVRSICTPTWQCQLQRRRKNLGEDG